MVLLSCFSLGGSFIDSRDGQKYNVTTIDGQEWMAENMRYNVRGSRCVNDMQKLCGIGRYYNFDMAEQVCPSGWHLPTKKEWNNIFDKVGEPFVMFLPGYCFETGTCFDIDEAANYWTSSDDNDSWTEGRHGDSFFKSMIPRRQKAYIVRYNVAQGKFVNPTHSFFKDGYFFAVRCKKN